MPRKLTVLPPLPSRLPIKLPPEILSLPQLNKTDLSLLSWIEFLQNKEIGGCNASNSFFCQKINRKEFTLKYLIAKLKCLDLIERVSFDGRTRILRTCKEKWPKKNSSFSTSEV